MLPLLVASLWTQRKRLNHFISFILSTFLMRDGGDQHLDCLHGHGSAQRLD